MSAPSIEELREAYDAALDGCEGWQEASALVRSALDELARLRELQRSIVGEDGRLFMSAPLAQWDELRAENERLRAALEAALPAICSWIDDPGDPIQANAEEALGRKPANE